MRPTKEFFKDLRVAIREREFESFHAKYEHYASPMAVLFGFIWDNITLKRIDLWMDNLVLTSYLAIAASSIILLNLREGGRLKGPTMEKINKLLPFLLQFVFGGLFSAFVVFYLRSASLFTSWPFFLFLGFLLIGNELFRARYLRLTFQISIFFIALFSYATLITPVILGQIGVMAFIAGGLSALAIISFILFLLFYLLPHGFIQSNRLIAGSIAGIYLLFNFLYFTNIIPPIPLSLKESGVYHFVQRTEKGEYRIESEDYPWYYIFKRIKEFHWVPGSPVYVFSSIFAPTKINTAIFHQWSYFEKEKDEWIDKDHIQFDVTGGRDGGYRGYTVKQNMESGNWRVDIETERGQLLGRVEFKIVKTSALSGVKSYFR